jgi:hemoglobin
VRVTDNAEPTTVYGLVGEQFFVELVERFYEGVAGDAVLRPLYANQDFTDAKARLCGFLVQYWGGPADYSAARGHPRLRMRHAPFVIGLQEHDAWLAAMHTAVSEAPLTDDQRARLWDYLVMAADSMVNAFP